MNEQTEYVVSWCKKQTHPGNLSVQVRSRTSCGEKPSEGSERAVKENMFSSWTSSSASHKSQVGEEVEIQVAVAFSRRVVIRKRWLSKTLTVCP
jgi:hypothetical protein